MINIHIISCINFLYNGNKTRKKGKILLTKLNALQYGNYGFRFKGNHQQRIVGMYALGWEKQTETSYDWNGLTRSESEIIVFQYTISGSGKIDINDDTFDLKVGDAFFVKIPSKHRYYLPTSSNEWEFIHITLFGDEALKCYEDITNNFGHIMNLHINTTPISLIIDMLRVLSSEKTHDAYETSAFAYSFLMELHRHLLNFKTVEEWPEAISKAIKYMNKHYHLPITLDDIVQASGLSKYHFNRRFHSTIHITPIQYLTNIRINQSIELLKNGDLTIDDIAQKVGFSNGNYFGKVFRSLLGIPPGEYRHTRSFITIDHFVGDY